MSAIEGQNERTRIAPDSPTAEPADLAEFGLSDGDIWLQRLREVAQPEPLGALGVYQILEEVSRGGQGVVFRARRPGYAHDIALKRPLAGAFATPAMLRRFRRELETAITLNHPNIVNVFDINDVGGAPLLAMEWIDGRAIDVWALGQPDQRCRLTTFLKVCDAVQHAHQRGVIHRDLKPSNILVDGKDEPHVLDFGLAKAIAPEGHARPRDWDTITQQFLGTPAYAAPEQLGAEGGAIDVRTDVYALGAVLYQILTDCLPHRFDGDLVAALSAVRDRDPPRPSSLTPAIDRELEAIIMMALAKCPADRYQSVEALGADLRRYLAGEAVVAHPPSRFYTLSKFVRRNRLVCGLTFGLLVAFVAFGCVSIVLASRAIRASEREVAARRAAEQVNDYLLQMLASPAAAARGGDVTVFEVLEETAGRIDQDLRDQPGLAADLHFTIGRTYYSLSRPEKAAPHFRAAYQIYVERLGRFETRTLDTGYLLVASLAFQDDPAGLALSEEMLTDAQRVFGKYSERTLMSMHNRAFALSRCARPPQLDAAIELYRQTLAIQEEQFGEGYSPRARTLHSMAAALRRAGRLAESAATFEVALAAIRDAYPQPNPRVLQCITDYVICLREMQRFDQAENLAREAIELTRRVLGEPWTAGALAMLGELQFRRGDLDAARISYEQGLAVICNRLAQRERHAADRYLQLGDWLRTPPTFRPLILRVRSEGRPGLPTLIRDDGAADHAAHVAAWPVPELLALLRPHIGRLEIGPQEYHALLIGYADVLATAGAADDADKVRAEAAHLDRELSNARP